MDPKTDPETDPETDSNSLCYLTGFLANLEVLECQIGIPTKDRIEDMETPTDDELLDFFFRRLRALENALSISLDSPIK